MEISRYSFGTAKTNVFFFELHFGFEIFLDSLIRSTGFRNENRACYIWLRFKRGLFYLGSVDEIGWEIIRREDELIVHPTKSFERIN